jgi:hypothetical protein
VKVIDPVEALVGRREVALLDVPSVRRMADVLAVRTGEKSWVRTLVAGVDRFADLTGHRDLDGLLIEARADPTVAERALEDLANALDGLPDASVAGLAMGPKVWFRLNRVAVPWRPLPALRSRPPLAEEPPADRVVTLSMVGSGLHMSELLRLRVRDLGSLDADGWVVPDIDAEPLAVCYRRLRDASTERVTFLSFHARTAVLAHLEGRRLAGFEVGPSAPLVAGPRGRAATRATVATARRRSSELIRVGNRINVELCRSTGEFFRHWGLPGSRWVPSPDTDGGDPR